MTWTLLLFMLLSYISGASSQHTLTQPPSQSGSLGQTTKLSCTISSNKNAFGWVQQIPGQAPRFLFYSSSRGTGVSDRFSVSESGNTGFLSISNLQLGDEADYYCYMWPSGASQCHDGANAQPVLTQPPSASASLGNTVKLSCTLSSAHSGYHVAWYQQRAGEAPQFIWYGDSTRGDGIPDRFTGSKSGGTRYLTIAGIQAEDEADYYCAASYHIDGVYGYSQ
ncbi:UNVERIFIED_CONTAM: hypothetical protein K2H54_021856 [Gekko kuhli]